MGFGDNSTVYQRATSTTSLRLECGEYTQATDATALVPTTLKHCVFGIAVADDANLGIAAVGPVSDTIDFSIGGGTGTFNGKVVHYIAAGW